MVLADLVSYGQQAKLVHSVIGPSGLEDLNNQIREIIDQCLKIVGEDSLLFWALVKVIDEDSSHTIATPNQDKDYAVSRRGDDAVIVFSDAAFAHKFASVLHRHTEELNEERKRQEQVLWYFRIACGRGGFIQPEDGSYSQDPASWAKAVAARLCPKAQPGEFLIDPATFEKLPDDLKKCYGGEEEVGGKDNGEDSFLCHRWTVVKTEPVVLPNVIPPRGASVLMPRFPDKLKVNSENSLVILEVYRKWIQESSETFSIPGIRDIFSMQYDWIQLEVVKTIEKEAPFNAAFIPEVSSSRSVVIGNSGGGKSTLTKYLAYRLSSLGKKVLRVRLSSIRKLLATHTFNDSILINSTDKLSLTLEKAKFALGEPDYLIADGLDECEEDCFMIAEELENWAAGHLSTKIIVTTRTGYETGILGGWEFLKLLPLKRQDIIKFAQRLLEDSLKVETFLKWLETRNNISLASTNPLILGFLVQIYQDNPQEIPNRSMLYEKIITLAYKRPLQDRKSSKVDEEIAYKILNIIGLKILENPNLSKRKLKELISQKISNDFSIKLFDARQEVEKVLFFWINNRILEDVKIGTDDLIIFTHKTINSYVAACCICERDPQDFNRWFMKNYQNPLWKEPILFLSNLGWAAEMISYLLRCDAYNKISVNNIYMAIEIMNELSEPIPNLFTLTIPHFQSFLISSDYDLVFQMAEALLTLSSEFKALLHEVSRPLLEHFQSSTRLAAIRLSIMSENNVDLDIIKKTIDYLVEQIDENIEQHSHKYSIKFKTNPFPPRKLMGGFQSDTLVECFRILVEKEIGNELFHRLNLVVTQGHINYKSNKALRAIIDAKQAQLRAEGDVKTYQKFSSLREQLWGNPFKILKDFSNNIRERAEELLKEIKYRQRDDHPDRFFLKTIIRMFNSSLDINILSEIIAFPLLGILLEGMSYHEVLVEDWESISKNPDSDALEIVIRGAISFLTIDYQQLAAEAYKLLDNITWNDNLDEIEAALEYPEGDQKNDLIWGYQKLLEIRTRGNDTISSYIPTKLPIDPKWDCLHELIDYRCALEDALTHPSNFIRHNAILILFYMIGKEETIVSLQKKGIDDVIFNDE